MKNVIKKMFEAKKIVASDATKKQGKNTYSGYSYFTPEQVKSIVDKACFEVGILTVFNMKNGEHGLYGVLTCIDIESGEKMDFEMKTETPSIKATNVAQQLGGAMTYTERYLKMSAFGIADNALDFDTTENTKKSQQKPAVPTMTADQFAKAKESTDVKKLKLALAKFRMTSEQKTEIENRIKDLQNDK